MQVRCFVLVLCVGLLAATKSEDTEIGKADDLSKCERGVGHSTLLPYYSLDVGFHGDISFGTPGQNIRALFNTGSLITWVISATCDTIACFYHHNPYDHNSSKTYEPNGTPVKFTNQIGNFSAFLSADTITIGQYNVEHQTFAEIIKTPSAYVVGLYDGVLGLGHGLFSENGTPTLLNTMLSQKLIYKPIFSLFFNGTRRELILGHSIIKRCSDKMTYVPVANKASSYWQIPVDRILIDRHEFGKGIIANVDTGSYFVSGPMKEIAAIATVIGAKCYGYGLFKVPCQMLNEHPKVQIVLGGTPLEWQQYIFEFDNDDYGVYNVCLSGFQGTNDNTWTIGSLFISEYRTQFDMEQERVGFAKLLQEG